MKQFVTSSIVLARTNYGEADRILTLLTPDYGKLRLMARGSRKIKSRLAGGIELFSISDIAFIRGKGEIGTLVSARLKKYFAAIVQDIERVQLGYDCIKRLHRATEDEPEPEYFELLEQSFGALNNPKISVQLIALWFQAQLIKIAGHSPNLQTNTDGQKLAVGDTYQFDFEAMAFVSLPTGRLGAAHIKCLRLLFSGNPPETLAQVQQLSSLLTDVAPLIQTMSSTYIRF